MRNNRIEEELRAATEAYMQKQQLARTKKEIEHIASVFVVDMQYLFQPPVLNKLATNNEKLSLTFNYWWMTAATKHPTPTTRYPTLLDGFTILFMPSKKAFSDEFTKKYKQLEQKTNKMLAGKRNSFVVKLQNRHPWLRDLDDFKGSPLLLESKKLIERAAYWHRGDDIIRAPGHARNVELGSYGYELQLGANSFLVAYCFTESAKALRKHLDVFASGEDLNLSELIQELTLIVRSSVANVEGDIYQGLYPSDGGYLMFGTQSIHINRRYSHFWCMR